jgi:Ulp1 family protease
MLFSTKIEAENLYDYSRIFIPIFTKEISHWSLVLIIPSEKSIIHYDSLPFTGPERPEILTWALHEVVKWVKALISQSRWSSEGWKDSAYSVSKQPPHGNDCGICTVMNSRLLLSGKHLPQQGSFTPNLMAQVRRAFAKELAEGKFSDEVCLEEVLSLET